MQLKDIPFVVGTSTSQSHSVAGNYQQLIAMLKSHNTAVCGRGPHGVQGRGESNKRGILPKEDSRRCEFIIIQTCLIRHLYNPGYPNPT